ncbi:MAG: hypothetical protein ABIS50_12740 [Luteolibacter sp.]|uniref:hypothetical protein n=2 Tax=Luteolibacter sp. TaxID=1962973 RepID=UPI00326409E0
MRVPILLLCSAAMLHTVRAETLSDADREALLDSLSKLHDEAESKVDGKFRIALAAFKNAMGSDDAAIELYLNCMERVNFDEEKKKAADFRDWKRKEAEKLSDPGMRLALRHQLRWLILTMQSIPEKADRTKLAAEAQQAVDTIFDEIEKLKGQEEILGQSVMSTVFARAYDINHIKVENWPLNPVELDSIYGEVILPPLRRPSQLAGLRAAWIKRIQQEGSKAQYWSGRRGGGGGEERKGAPAPSGPSPAYTRFLEETQPKLQWDMEIDLYRSGDESGAATRMLAHLEKHIAHPSAKAWSDQLKQLLKPAAAPAPAAPPEAGTTAP